MKNKLTKAVGTLTVAAILVSCVSKKKYNELETDYNNTRSELLKTRVEKEDLRMTTKEEIFNVAAVKSIFLTQLFTLISNKSTMV